MRESTGKSQHRTKRANNRSLTQCLALVPTDACTVNLKPVAIFSIYMFTLAPTSLVSTLKKGT